MATTKKTTTSQILLRLESLRYDLEEFKDEFKEFVQKTNIKFNKMSETMDGLVGVAIAS